MDQRIPEPLRDLLESPWGLWMVAAIAVLITAEAGVWRLRHRRLDAREDASSIAVGIGYFLVNRVVSGALFYGIQIYVYQYHRLFTWQVTSAWTWGAALLIGDFVYYWVHRAEHRVRFLWCAHENHHSARQYSFSTSIRMPWGEIFYHPLVALWRPLLGFHPILYPIIDTFNLLMGLLQHTELVGKLGWLELPFATPSHHRVHHGKEPQYIDKNYGARLILWDRMFGTFEPEREHPTYGLTHDIATYNPLKIVVHGYVMLFRDVRSAPTWRAKLQHFYKPPDWSPAHRGP